jgi:hypothetical protein
VYGVRIYEVSQLNKDMAAALRAPFDKSDIEYLPKGGRSLAYVGHARVTDRLIQVDPEWTMEPLAVNQYGSPMFEGDEYNRPVGLWVKLTVGGVTRIGYGTTEYHDKGDEHKIDPEAIKKILSDALRNAAMRFGIALDLWTKEVGDDVGAPAQAYRPQTTNGNGNASSAPAQAPLGSAATVKPSPAQAADPGNEATLLGKSIGNHEHDDGEDGRFIIKKSAKTGKLYAQCNARDVVVDGVKKQYCNTFPPYGALDAWVASLKASDVDPADVPASVGENISVPPSVQANNHHKEFIDAALDAEFSVGRPWLKNFDNDRMIAFVEHLEELGKVPAITFKKNHYGDRAEMSRDQLLQLGDALYVAHSLATHKATQDDVDFNMEDIPFD